MTRGKAEAAISVSADCDSAFAWFDGLMSRRVQSLREDHRLLQRQVDKLCEAARAVEALDVDGRRAVQEHLVDFLRERVVPHTRIDERVLYPEVTRRLGDPLATASMNYDHLAIRRWIEDIAETDPHDSGRLQQLLYGLHALIAVHMWKEDELYFAALESPSWPSTSGLSAGPSSTSPAFPRSTENGRK